MTGVVRVESGQEVMLYDPLHTSNFSTLWFEPSYWTSVDGLTGSAHGRGNTWFFKVQSRTYALRHYRRGGLAARVSSDQYFYINEARTRPVREFYLNLKLRQIGLPVPLPVAVRVQRDGFSYRGDLITEQIAHAKTLAESLAMAQLPIAHWSALGRMLASFHAVGLYHADLNAHNVLLDLQSKFWLIDFDRGALRKPGLWQDANLVRLRHSILKICDGLSSPLFNENLWAALLSGYRT